MNRDALLATLIGLGLGLLLTGVIIVGPQLIKKLPRLEIPKMSLSLPKSREGALPTPTPASFSLNIQSPLPDTISESSQLVVSGTAPVQSIVVVASPTDEDVIVVEGSGSYAGKITLTEGKNDIFVTSYTAGKPTTQTVTVFYTPESF